MIQSKQSADNVCGKCKKHGIGMKLQLRSITQSFKMLELRNDDHLSHWPTLAVIVAFVDCVTSVIGCM